MEVVQTMTSIGPPINLPPMPAQSRDPRNSPMRSDPGYAALAKPSADLTGKALPASPKPGEAAALRSAIAHIFNAFGFFPADGENPSPMHTTAAVTVAGDQAVESHRTVADKAVLEAPLQPGQAPATLPRVALARAEAAHGRGAHPAPHATTNLPSEANTTDPFLRAIENRLTNEPELPEQANAKAAERREAQTARRDRVTLKIAEHSVELIARLSDLSEEDRQRLLDEVDCMLAEHGLSLASATLNGEPFSQVVGRAR